ncbi:MAG: hypothetical protein GKR89_25375 [Candidatus Latescibacteria bacterium]|nr:hypothetical protein [Candidatus Latescibacterota bacterium]
MSETLTQTDPRELCRLLNSRAPEGGLFQGDRARLHPDSRLPWRISPEPFQLQTDQLAFLEQLGPALLKFYQAANLLYGHSLKGVEPAWIHQYLDQGKPEHIIDLSRLNRVKSHLPLVMRPDLMLTEEGFRVAELDSVPGGIGFTGNISRLYADLGYDLVGGADGLVEGFYQALQAHARQDQPVVCIVVSDQSGAYHDEMEWLAQQAQSRGEPVYCRHPRDVHFDEEGLFIHLEGEVVRLDMIYRFFELFDLRNIPKVEPITYFTKKNAVRVSPPLKAFLEEKMWLALFHHPQLQDFWRRQLGQGWEAMSQIVPPSWIVDPAPVPQHAVIPGLQAGGQAVNNWAQLGPLSKKEREYVLKPSGFSPLAEESRGVSVGHDLSEEEWAAKLEEAQAHFGTTPYILQEFQKAARLPARYYDFARDEVQSMRGRVLLRPYYYVIGQDVRLAGVQTIICPADKKILHGMVDAILVPCTAAATTDQAF